MAPPRSLTRLGHIDPNPRPNHDHDLNAIPHLFIDPMLGTSLSMYVEKDVQDKDTLVDLIMVSSRPCRTGPCRARSRFHVQNKCLNILTIPRNAVEQSRKDTVG